MSKPLKIAVLALGRIGQIHLKNVVEFPGVEAVAITSSEKGRAFASSIGVSEIYRHCDEILKNKSIQAAVICSPSDTHALYTRQLMEAGKDVFCEKPLELKLDLIHELDDLSQKLDCKLMIGFDKRFDPDYRRVHEIVQAGEIGDPHILRITSRDPGAPPISYIKSSGGIFLDMMIHDFDMARFIVGAEVKEVYAQGKVRIDPAIGEVGDFDTVVATLTFENDTIAILEASRKATYGYDQRLEIFGSKGMAQMDNHTLSKANVFNASGGHSPKFLPFFLERYEQAYKYELHAFINSLLKDAPVPVNAYDGYMSTAIALAATKSAKEGCIVKMEEFL